MKKYNFNEKIFDRMTKESAYLLGIIAADATVGSNKNVLKFQFSKKDINYLKLIKNKFKANHPIHTYKTAISKITGKRYETCQLAFYSNYLLKKLNYIGIKNKKSNREILPKIPKKYIFHFIRGYLDGDGCISIRKPYKTLKKHDIQIIILGNKNFLFKIKTIINSTTKIKVGTVQQQKGINISRLEYHGRNSCIPILEYLYKDSSNLRLERKYKIYSKFLKMEQEYSKLFFKNGRPKL